MFKFFVTAVILSWDLLPVLAKQFVDSVVFGPSPSPKPWGCSRVRRPALNLHTKQWVIMQGTNLDLDPSNLPLIVVLFVLSGPCIGRQLELGGAGRAPDFEDFSHEVPLNLKDYMNPKIGAIYHILS